MFPLKFRVALSKLRLSSHQLRIETGRHAPNRIERNQRKCLLCNSPDIEDEYHFVLICPVFDVLRKKYIQRFYFNRPNVYKFIQLMQSNNENVLNNLGRYICMSLSHLR